jgi:hypothetical protein
MKLDSRIQEQYEAIKRGESSADPQRAYHRHKLLVEVISQYSEPGDLPDIGADGQSSRES